MNIKIRALLFLIALSFVAVTGPMLVLYAQGYRYNFSKHKVEQTGVLFVKSYPRSATIIINEEEITKKTPTEVPNLLPTTYRIAVTKNGYTTWKKNLTIEPKKTTFIEDITLFKSIPESTEVLVTSSSTTQSLCSPENNKLALINNNNLTIIDTSKSKVTNQFAVANETQIIGWSKNSINLLLSDKQGYFIYSPESQVKKQILFNKKPLEDVIWENNSNTIVYGKLKNILYKYNFSTNETQIYNNASTNNVVWQTIQPMNGYNIGVYQLNNQTYLSQVNGKDIKNIMVIPDDNNYKIHVLSDKYILLINKSLDSAYIIDPTDKDNPLQTYMNGLKNFSWLKDTLLYWNEHEINVYHLPTKAKQTIERTSQQIKNVSWHNGLVSIFTIIDDKLIIYELDNRDKRNILEYQSLGDITKDEAIICFSRNGEELITNFNNDKKGIYQLKIQ